MSAKRPRRPQRPAVSATEGRLRARLGRSGCSGERLKILCSAPLVDHVIPHVPVRQWVLALPIPLRLLLAAQPRLVTPVLQVVLRVITRHLLGQAGLKAEEADSGAVTLIQR